MGHISMRDLQKISRSGIAALDGPTLVKAGREPVALLTPLAGPAESRDVVIERAMRGAYEAMLERGPERDDTFFAANPDLDPTIWTEEMIERVIQEHVKG